MTSLPNADEVAPMKVWVLSIDHRHGTDTSVHLTEKGARDSLTAYVDYWFDDELPGQAAPADDGERVEKYFEHFDGAESYILTEMEVGP